MNHRDLKIASNVMALASKRKGKNKRSVMLRTIMPFLSRETGDALADAIDKHDTAKFTNTWNKVRAEITAKLQKQRHSAHASLADGKEYPEGDFLNIYSNFALWVEGKLPRKTELHD